MKITISSPDGLGDFILRIPMLHSLLDAGNELQLFLRPPASELARELFPEVEQHTISCDPSYSEVQRKKNPFDLEHQAIKRFDPDLYVATLFSVSFFDEIWMEKNKKKVPVCGFSTTETFWPSGTICDPVCLSNRFQISVEVPVSLPELEKNRLLGSAILGRSLELSAPQIFPGEEALLRGREILERNNLKEGGYWIGCVGGRSGLMMKDWGEKNWREFFSLAMTRDDQTLLLLGNTKEWESLERIRSEHFRSINLASEPPPLSVSLALVAMSRGYVGRDSGVMHLAAATGRPLLAAYGGAHWGRFLPSSGPAIVVTQAMSCRMCDFSCPHESPHCITGIGMETMRRAWESLPTTEGIVMMEQKIDPLIDCVSSLEAQAFAIAEAEERRVRSEALRSEGIISRFLRQRFGVH